MFEATRGARQRPRFGRAFERAASGLRLRVFLEQMADHVPNHLSCLATGWGHVLAPRVPDDGIRLSVEDLDVQRSFLVTPEANACFDVRRIPDRAPL